MNDLSLIDLLYQAAQLAHLPKKDHIAVQEAYEKLKKNLTEKPLPIDKK